MAASRASLNESTALYLLTAISALGCSAENPRPAGGNVSTDASTHSSTTSAASTPSTTTVSTSQSGSSADDSANATGPTESTSSSAAVSTAAIESAATGSSIDTLDTTSEASTGTSPVTNTDTSNVNPTSACALTPERVRVTEVEVGMAVDANEDEAALRPLVISPLPNGGSRLAWMGMDEQLHITALDNDDNPKGTTLNLDARDFSDLLADDKGGVALLTRDAKGDGERHCGNLTNLCGNADSLPAQYACWDMYMVRFDGEQETWATQLTESSVAAPPYLTSPTDEARRVYIWQAYAHHGRLATNGESYAGYYGAAISVSEACVQPDTSQATGVNIHQGDRMDVVDVNGARTDGDGAFQWGCSHSGYERLVWDPKQTRWVAVCKTDNNNRLAVAPNYLTVRSVDLAANNISDLVLHPEAGYWLAASDAQVGGDGLADVHLLHFTLAERSAPVDMELPVAASTALNERAPLLARYGSDGLVVAWESSPNANDLRANDAERKLYMQARKASDGAPLGEAIQLDVPGNRYHSLRSFADGSVGFPARGLTATSIRVVRILPCQD